MMDINKAVEYQNPAHVHSGTTAETFTVASGAAERTRLTPTGLERVGDVRFVSQETSRRELHHKC